jgi:hypothetical protein
MNFLHHLPQLNSSAERKPHPAVCAAFKNEDGKKLVKKYEWLMM